MNIHQTNYVDPVNGQMLQKPSIAFDLPYLGALRTRSTDEVGDSGWFIGCETLDRDFANYDAYKEYLKPLGIKGLRFQGGWAKTERQPGVYDWAWMDHIINDSCSRGLRPWLQTGYGNPVYPGAGGKTLGAGLPQSVEGLEAYDRWVGAMVTRYTDKVLDWEVWNEPNFGDNKLNTPEAVADFNIQTARIIKGIQPEARISALAMGHIDIPYAERFLRRLSDCGACELFHDLTYHDYVYNPDGNKLKVYQLRQLVEKYAPKLSLRQGENGAPSRPYAGGALWDYAWSEISQAKWDTRRMLENLGHDIECSVYSLAEHRYTADNPISNANAKGILQTSPEHEVIRPKIAYYAIGHVASLFDDAMARIPGVRPKLTLDQNDLDKYQINTDRSMTVHGYADKRSGKRLYTLWRDDTIPNDDLTLSRYDIDLVGSHFEQPVILDILTGCVYDVPSELWYKDGVIDRFRQLPMYDSPVVLAERSLIELR